MSHYFTATNIIFAASLCIFYSISCVLLGGIILKKISIFDDNESNTDKKIKNAFISASFLLGIGIYGALWQLVASFGFFHRFLIVSIMALFSILGSITCYRTIINSTFRSIKDGVHSFKNVGILWFPLIFILLFLLYKLAILVTYPPICDGLAYYMAEAKLIGTTGNLLPIPGYESLCLFGLNAEMHGALLFLLGNEGAAHVGFNIMVWIAAVAGAQTLWVIADELNLGAKGKWAVIFMLFTSTAYILVMYAGKTDTYSSILGLSSIFWILQLGKGRDKLVSFIAGVMAGFALNSKFSYIVVMLPMTMTLALLILNDSFVKTKPKTVTLIKQMACLGLIGILGILITFIPHIIKNYMVFDEPLAPFIYLHNVLDKSAMDQIWFSPETTRFIVLTYPLAIFFGQYPMQFGNLSPALLVFLLPALLFFRMFRFHENKRLIYLTVSALIGVIFWVILRPSVLAPRYIMTPLIALLPFGAFIVEKIWEQKSYYISKISVYMTLLLMMLTININLSSYSDIAYLFRNGMPFFAQNIWESFKFINEKAEQNDKVFVAAYDSYPLRNDLLVNFRRVIQGDGFWSFAVEQGAKWVYFDKITYGKVLSEFPHFEGEKIIFHQQDKYKITAHPYNEGYPTVVYQIQKVS